VSRQAHGNIVLRTSARRRPSFSAYLVSYQSSGLKVYAMVAVPNTSKPKAGYPVLIANHGFVATPEKYGITAEGIDSRPGDYYRDVPEIYAREGFLVVMPDYRGHNISEGFTTGYLATNYYTLDVLALLSALSGLDDAEASPMRPMPTMPKVFPFSPNMGCLEKHQSSLLLHSPAFTAWSCTTMPLAYSNNSAATCWAKESVP